MLSICSAYVQTYVSTMPRSYVSQISVQIRILKQVQACDSRRERENHLILATIRHSAWSQAGLPPSSSHASLRSPGSSVDLASNSPPVSFPSPPTPSSFSQLGSPPPMLPTESHVLPTLQDIIIRQNENDTADDIVDLRQRLRDALAAQTDVEVLETLGIRHEEMPEALKTLQRTLEKLNDRHVCSPTPGIMPLARSSVDYSAGHGRNRMHNRTQSQHATEEPQSSGRPRSRTMSSIRRMSTGSSIMGSPPVLSTRQSFSEDRTLELEFVESGIDALRRMSRNTDMNLPSWTITRYCISLDTFFSALTLIPLVSKSNATPRLEWEASRTSSRAPGAAARWPSRSLQSRHLATCSSAKSRYGRASAIRM